MRFEYTTMAHWPPLAWLAQCSSRDDSVLVRHGEWVEAREHWFCEGVWDGEFPAGDFDNTDIIAGSGARLRADKLVFVSSGSDIDRLHFLDRGESILVSNSLVCLLAWVDGEADPSYFAYGADFADYRYTVFGKRTLAFPSSAGTVGLTYFANLVWSNGQLVETDKPCGDRRFSCFSDYQDFMHVSMRLVAGNAKHESRSRPFRLLCPLSNGYDSPTVAALAHGLGDVEAFTFDTDREGNDDSGEAIAATLGIPCHVIDRDAWLAGRLAEVPFIACSGSIGDLPFQPAERLLESAVLLSGYGGDLTWDKHASSSPPVAIGGGSMLGLTEYRLWAGFLNCPVPLWGIRQLDDLIRLSNAAEMQPWDVGGNYTRPICRRIVESAGVPRTAFGVGKRGVSVVPRARIHYLSPASLEDLFAWLRERREQGKPPGGKFPHPMVARFLDHILTPLATATGVLERIVRRRPLKWLARPVNAVGERLTRPYYHHHYLVHWAIDRAKRRYRTDTPGQTSSRL
jgi:hypothetical protein